MQLRKPNGYRYEPRTEVKTSGWRKQKEEESSLKYFDQPLSNTLKARPGARDSQRDELSQGNSYPLKRVASNEQDFSRRGSQHNFVVARY